MTVRTGACAAEQQHARERSLNQAAVRMRRWLLRATYRELTSRTRTTATAALLVFAWPSRAAADGRLAPSARGQIQREGSCVDCRDLFIAHLRQHLTSDHGDFAISNQNGTVLVNPSWTFAGD